MGGVHDVRFDKPAEAPLDLRFRDCEAFGKGRRWPIVVSLRPLEAQTDSNGLPANGSIFLFVVTERGQLKVAHELISWHGMAVEVRELPASPRTRRSRRSKSRCC